MKILFTVLIVLTYLNLVFLNWKILFDENKSNKSDAPEARTVIPEIANSCSISCLAAIQQATSAAKPITTTKVTVLPTQSQKPVSNAKEFFIPFGGGTISSSDWTDVPGLIAYVDSTNYSQIKAVTFEASVHVPTGNETVSVRLLNATDQRSISELFFNGDTNSQFIVSQPITLDYAKKLYKVQMKTQLNYPAVLDQARIHILTW